MNRILIIFFFFQIFSSGYGQEKSEKTAFIEITYIANEGMLLSSGDQQVLIDGLFQENVYGYQHIPKKLREQLETAVAPYDQIDLLLVTHLHLDHFHAESIGRHLSYNENAALIAGQDVVGLLSSDYADFAAIKNRIHSVALPWKQHVALTVDGFEVSALRIRHGGSMNYGMDHLGYLLHVGPFKILHIGDVEIAEEDFSSFALPDEEVDIAFIPDWFLKTSNGQKIVKELIQPKEIIAIHVRPSKVQELKQTLQSNFPKAVVFEAPLDVIRFEMEME